MLTQAQVYIKGDVIGVGFRAWVKIHTKMNRIKGWIRNVYEKPEIFGKGGGIEAVFQGQEDDLIKIIEIVKQGSPISQVEEVEVFQQDPKELFETFEIRK